jgi:hypothetical protein
MHGGNGRIKPEDKLNYISSYQTLSDAKLLENMIELAQSSYKILVHIYAPVVKIIPTVMVFFSTNMIAILAGESRVCI